MRAHAARHGWGAAGLGLLAGAVAVLLTTGCGRVPEDTFRAFVARHQRWMETNTRAVATVEQQLASVADLLKALDSQCTGNNQCLELQKSGREAVAGGTKHVEQARRDLERAAQLLTKPEGALARKELDQREAELEGLRRGNEASIASVEEATRKASVLREQAEQAGQAEAARQNTTGTEEGHGHGH